MKFELLQALARCRVVDGSTIDLPLEVFTELLKEKLIVKKEETGEENIDRVIYSLTDKGEVFIKQNIPEIKEIYRGFVLQQDLKLSDFYLRRSKAEKASWITRDDLIKKYKLPGTVDGAFINKDGKLEGVKTLSNTADYSAVEKIEKFLDATEIESITYIMFTK